MMKNLVYVILVFHLLLSSSLSAVLAQSGDVEYERQDIENRSFNEADWQNLNESLDYSGKPPKPKKTTEDSDTPAAPDSSDSSSIPDLPDLSPVFKALLLILIVGLLGLLIYTFIQRSELSFDPAAKGENDSIEEDLGNIVRLEEELDKRNVDPYLLKAEKEGDYYLAVRLHFLALLKQLHEQDLIQWKKDRTNRTYLNQMRRQEHYSQFRGLTLVFERVWYGDYHPPKEEYETIKSQFSGYREQLQNAVPV